MARVIEDVPPVEKRVVCRDGCGKTLGYTAGEVKKREWTDYGGGPAGEEWVVCPSCGKHAVVRSW